MKKRMEVNAFREIDVLYSIEAKRETCKYKEAARMAGDEDHVICCQYSPDIDFYACPYFGETVAIDGDAETGPATGDCAYPGN